MRCAALLPVLVSFSAFGQQVTCTADVPPKTCRFAIPAFEFWESLLLRKVPIVIADRTSFEQELKSLDFVEDRRGLVRNPVAFQQYAKSIIFERVNGNPCPARVVVSTDSFRPIDEKTFKPVAGFDLQIAASDADYVGGFLAGCESSLDY